MNYDPRLKNTDNNASIKIEKFMERFGKDEWKRSNNKKNFISTPYSANLSASIMFKFLRCSNGPPGEISKLVIFIKLLHPSYSARVREKKETSKPPAGNRAKWTARCAPTILTGLLDELSFTGGCPLSPLLLISATPAHLGKTEARQWRVRSTRHDPRFPRSAARYPKVDAPLTTVPRVVLTPSFGYVRFAS